MFIFNKKFILILAVIFQINSCLASAEYDSGMKAYNSGHYSLAKGMFQKAIQVNGKDVNARYMLSQIYVKEKNYSAAKTQYEYIMKIAPTSQAAQYSKIGLDLIENRGNNNTVASANNSTTVQTSTNTTGSITNTTGGVTNTTSSITNTKSVPSVSNVQGPADNLLDKINTDTIKTPNPQNSLLTYHYYIPSSVKNKTNYPVIVYVHGMGGNGKQDFLHDDVLQFADKNGFVLVAPTFKFSENDFQKEQSYQYPKAWAGQSVKDILARLKSKKVNFKNIYFVGFSAGAQFVSRFAVQNPDYLKGCVILGCGAKIVPEKKQSTRFFFGIGENEEQFRKDSYNAFVQASSSLGIDLTAKTYPKLGHGTNQDEFNDFMNFILETENKK